MSNRDKQVIKKMLSEIEVLEQLIAGFDAANFIADERTKRAVCMTLINMGELSKSVSEDFKAATSHIPWKSIAGMRDVTAHKYQTIKMGDVWHTVKHDLPVLKAQLTNLINVEA